MKFLLIVLGSLSLALGILGIFLPVLPTTPFLLLSAALYMRSSQRLYDWLMAHKHLGPYIKNFREHKALPLRVKVVSVSMVWATLLYCAFFVAKEWWMSAVFIAIATGVTVHILNYRTLKKRM
ncbi:MAG: YbaN family protein [Bacteroidaceae bacterium]|nr:YbaN family protein [Bacteroidaceae bacterium]